LLAHPVINQGVNMATYKEIQKWVKKEYSFVPKSCWIAHVKEISGLPIHKAYNRVGVNRLIPCPMEKKEGIRSAFIYFGMIK
jgi:hypothetical protein